SLTFLLLFLSKKKSKERKRFKAGLPAAGRAQRLPFPRIAGNILSNYPLTNNKQPHNYRLHCAQAGQKSGLLSRQYRALSPPVEKFSLSK
ncbi:MAG TPA: hypothetical protein PKD42_13650, partial [Chitinophagaceae bacterium]|nr:hypothetical protein [Chitinophagaceae bacterium]